MKPTLKGILSCAVVSALVAGSVVYADDQAAGGAATAGKATAADNGCKGKNGCDGTHKNKCKGKKHHHKKKPAAAGGDATKTQ